VTSRRTFLLTTVSAVASCGRRKAEGFGGYAFVANEEGQAIAVVDLGAFAVTRHIRLGGRPTAVVAHPILPAVYALTPEPGTVYEISTENLALRRRARINVPAVSMRLGPYGEALWVLSASGLVRLPLDRFRTETRIPLPGRPSDFDISPDGRRAAVSLGEQGNVALVNLLGKRMEHIAKTSKTLGLIRYRKDGKLLLVGNLSSQMISILEPLTGELMVHLPLAVRPENFCFKADGGQLFISGEGMDAVAVVYPYQTQVGATILAGRSPGFMAASTQPDYLFVANPESGDVTIVNVETQRVIAVAAVGRKPGYIAITPDNQYALVLNRESGDMAVIRIAAITAQRRKSAPLFTMIPVGSKPVSAAVRAV
jgi:YVTN family beta-propeller protein